MGLLCGVLVLSPHLDCLITLTTQQPGAAAIESQGEDAIFGSNRAGLRLTHDILEVVA
jgi:hypothetical protein